MKIPVSELLVRFLERLGIEHIFGMPGAHILPVYDSLYGSTVKSVLVKHEQGAAFMAGGYARASGKIGACITTAGPGATNLVTGIANAYADKQPVLIITGETSTHIFGKGGLQESSGEGGSIDQVSLFKGITRYNRIVERTDYLANVLNRTAKILLSDNSGPVLLSFPFNVQKELVDDSILDEVKTDQHLGQTFETNGLVTRCSELIAAARNVIQLLLIGYILKIIFTSENLLFLGIISLIMLLVAGYEINSRQRYPLKRGVGFKIGTSALFLSSFTMTLLALMVIVAPTPWYEPQYAGRGSQLCGNNSNK